MEMNYIQAHCRTNLDNYDCSLVQVFAALPRVNDYVQVMYKGNVTRLRIVSITHKTVNNGKTPYIEVELNK